MIRDSVAPSGGGSGAIATPPGPGCRERRVSWRTGPWVGNAAQPVSSANPTPTISSSRFMRTPRLGGQTPASLEPVPVEPPEAGNAGPGRPDFSAA